MSEAHESWAERRLEPQPHGGALSRAGGARPGAGRPKKAVVEQLLQHFDELYELADNEERAEFHKMLVRTWKGGGPDAMKAAKIYQDLVYGPTPPHPKEQHVSGAVQLFGPPSWRPGQTIEGEVKELPPGDSALRAHEEEG